ncbi:MAG: hypothetical protein JNL90_10870 [Planctomycetes bacterium]|nr:hypothetical protein [Planctomycetota bacterium]
MATLTRSDREFRVGSTVSRTLATWIATLPKTLPLALVALAPAFAWNWIQRERIEFSTLESLFAQLIDTACSVVLAGFVLFIAFKRLMREPASLGTALQVGIRRFVPLLLVGFVTAAFVILPILLAAVADTDGGGSLVTGSSLLLNIANAVIATMLAASTGAVVVESLGPIAAIRRSLALTKDCRKRIFLANLLIGLVAGILFAIATFGLSYAFELDFPAEVVVGVLVGTLTATLSAVVYHDLRALKDGVDVHELARVFA